MLPQHDLPPDIVGDFDALLRQLDRPADMVTIDGGYANLMTRIVSPEFRRRCTGEHY